MKRIILISTILLSACQMSRQDRTKLSTIYSEDEMAQNDPALINNMTGMYLGYLKLPKRDDLLPISFSFEKKAENQVISTVKVSHFNHKSSEFISEVFSNVNIYQESNLVKLNFLGDSKNFKISNALAQNDVIIGKLILPDASEGSFEVSKNLTQSPISGTPIPSKSVVNNISGRYISQCDQAYRELLLTKSKNNEKSSESNMSFSGKIGFWQNRDCFDGKKNCERIELSSIKYNIATGRLDLNSLEINDSCQITKNGIKCGNCLYTKSELKVIGKNQ